MSRFDFSVVSNEVFHMRYPVTEPIEFAYVVTNPFKTRELVEEITSL